jgi:hypothetical protein
MTATADEYELAARAFESPDRGRWATPYDLGRALNPKLLQTPALALIQEHLMWAASTPDARLIISMPPQEGKSDLGSRRFPLWLLMHNPDLRIVIASYASTVARRLSRFVRDDVTANQQLLGMRVRRDLSSQHEWEVAGHEGGLYAVGTGGALTSRAADILIIDDPIKGRDQADSVVFRSKVWDWWTETAATRLSPGAPVVLILTRWHEDDLAGRLIKEDEALPEEEREWRVLTIPAQCEDEATDPLGRQAGEFMASARKRTLLQWERIKRRGARTWAALYQGRPAPAEGGIFQWDWIRPFRVNRRDVPDLARVVVAIDTTGGGHDAAGIVVAGRGGDKRTYVLADYSRRATAGGQWRLAWMACLDHEADELVYENNLVDPIMRRAAPAAWRRMVEQAKALQAAGVLRLDLDDADPEVLARRVRKAAAQLTVGGDDDVVSAADPHAALVAQLEQLLPYAVRVLASPERGPARLTGVRATRGKAIRAEPVSQAYETGQVSHAGVFPALEAELVTWQEGQDSPNRLDALVWAWTALNGVSTTGRVGSAAGRGRISTGPSTSSGGR